MNVRTFIPLAILGIILASLGYVLYLSIDRDSSLTGATVVENRFEPVALFLVDGDLQEAKTGEYLIAKGKTIKVIEITDETALLEAGGKNYFIAVEKKIRVHDTDILLSMIR